MNKPPPSVILGWTVLGCVATVGISLLVKMPKVSDERPTKKFYQAAQRATRVQD